MNDNFGNRANLESIMRGIAEALNKKEPIIFVGTAAQWNALTETEKSSYRIRIIDDDFSEIQLTNTVVDVVAEDNENAVSSGAVYSSINAVYAVITALQEKPSALEFIEDDENYTPPASVTVLTGEIFDTITSTVSGSGKIYGLGKIDDEYTRIIHPDGFVTSLTGF